MSKPKPKLYPITVEYRTSPDSGGFTALVWVDGKKYHVSVYRGRPVRIAFKPRGENRGFKWHGSVRDEQGNSLYNDTVTKSTGLRWLLEAAGVVPDRPSEIVKQHTRALWDDRDWVRARKERLEQEILQAHSHALFLDRQYKRNRQRAG